MDVFSAFPAAVVSGVWKIAAYQRGTVLGVVFDLEKASELDVIVDESDAGSIDSAPNAEPLDADLILYARSEQLPTLNVRALVAGYLLYDSDNDDYFAIVDAGAGRNQETGNVEHVELFVKQTEVAA